jgi:hypothetical protein
MRKPDDKCKTPGRSAGERAGRSLEKNAVYASGVGRGSTEDRYIPRTTPLSPVQPRSRSIVEEPCPIKPPTGRRSLRSAREGRILNTSPVSFAIYSGATAIGRRAS